MGIIAKILGSISGAKKEPPTKRGPFTSKEEALAAAKAEIDRMIAAAEGEK